MNFDLPGGRRLLLAGGQLGWFWIAVGALAIFLLVALFREERKLVSRRAGILLLSLRIAAAAALVSALFEPISARTFREAVKGRVIVAVDASESMSTADPGRTPSQRQALAKTLGNSPGDILETLPRREVARRLVSGKDAPLAKLANDHNVEAFEFAKSLTPGTLETLLKTPAKPDDPALLSTDWEPVLAEALKASADSAPVLGIVLVTDGRRNAPGDASKTVDRLAARGVPVFPVLVGSTVPPKDAAVASVKAPESVYKGDVATVEATLKLDGLAGREIAVTLERPGASPLRQVVTASGESSRPTVSFRVPLDAVGSVPLTMAVAPMDGDVRPDNDKRTVSVQVVDDKAKVLIVDGEARWEFRYLRNALARDPRVSVEAIVFHQPGQASSGDQAFTYKTRLIRKEESLPDPLGTYDVIVVGDVDPSDFPADAWTRLEAFVAQRGGTLVFSPGPRFFAALGGFEAARKLLPVLDPKPVDVAGAAEDPAHPSLPPGVAFLPVEAALMDSGSWPMLQLASDSDETARRWKGLPRLPWAFAGRAKPGATTLAIGGEDPATVLLAAQPYGLGKVLFVGTDATWRWRQRVGDAYHHRFWGQVVRWASGGKLAAGNAYVRFGPLKPRTAEGEPATIQARISEGVPGVGPDLLIAARVFKSGAEPGEALAVVPLRPATGQPRTYEGISPTLPIGAYVVRLDAPALTEALHLTPAPEATLEVIARDGTERVELAATKDPLDRLAGATGGKVFFDYEAASVPPLLRSRTKEIIRIEETPLWDQPVTLLLFFGVVTAEWVVRKRVGLP